MPTLRVLPDADRVEQVLLEAAASQPFVDATGFVSIAWLVDACAPARWLERSPVSPLGARLLVAAAARALGPGAFGDYAHEPAFARAAWELFQQLKLQDAGPADLGRALAAHPPRPRLQFVLQLWRAYEQRLAELKLADRGDLLRAAADRLGRELPPRLERFTQVEVHHLHDLPPARARLLQALATRCHALKRPVKLTLPSAGNPQVDALVNEALAGMERAWQGLDIDAWPEVPARPLAWIGGALFAEEALPQPAPQLSAFSAATPREEGRQIAIRVRRLLDAGTAPEQVAIVFRDLGDDAEPLVEALEEVGVPARVRLGMPLGATAVGRLALALPELIDDGFPVDGVLAVLESRYAPSVSKGAPDAAAWFQLAGLRDNHLGADPQTQEGAYAVRLRALAERTPRSSDAAEVRELSQRVQVLVRVGRLLGESGTALQLLAGWQRAIEELGLPSALRGPEPREAEGQALRRAVEQALARDQAAGEALSAFFDGLRSALVTSGVGAHKISRRDFARLIHDAARDVNLQARGPRSGSVRVLDVRAIAGLKFEHVFVGGLVDGRFPGRAPPLPLVAEEERAALNTAAGQRLFRLGAGEGAFWLPVRQAEDRLLFHLALCSASRTVTLSRARLDAGGRELIASPFLDELARVVHPFTEHAVPRAAVATLADVRSKADFYARVALEALSPRSTRLSAPSALGTTLWKRFSTDAWLRQASNLSAMEQERARFFTSQTAAAGVYSGDLSAPEYDGERARWFSFDAEHPVSVTALGRFGNCSFAGLMSEVLKLEAVEEQGEEPDARTRGTFWHLVFEELMPRMRDSGWLGKPVHELPSVPLDAAIDAAIEAAAVKAARRQALGHAQLWRLSREKARRMVRRVLSSEHAGQPFSEERWLPSDVEVNFGKDKPNVLPELRTVRLPAIREGEREIFFNGKIDRLDRGESGAGVVDYKAGKGHNRGTRARRELLASDFQLPVYVLALQQGLGVAQSDAAWLYLGDREPIRLSALLEKTQTLDELMALDAGGRDRAEAHNKKNLANAVHALAGKLRAGDFGARPQDCQSCSFGRVCRISQRRLHDEAG